ncbi:MAG: hypothetical protein WD824_05630 [Cyclobacteriaceae bacterium]
MKTLHHWSVVFASIGILLLMSACDHDMSIGSTVYEDGSLDRTMVLYDSDSIKISNNILGANNAAGWEVTTEPVLDSEKKESKNNITFKKHFASVEEANSEMNRDVDTLFHIHSTFEKQNRWFYTYLEYTDTYRSLDLFKAIPKQDYFTREDFAFIDRLPAEGKPIMKADSLYLARLTEKIFDFYATRTIFEELFTNMMTTMTENNVSPNWKDSLLHKKEAIYQAFLQEGDLGDNELLSVADKLKIPLPEAGREAIRKKTADIEKRLEFISEAYSGKYLHSIMLPWKVVDSNADSVNNNQLFWHPPVIKFLLKDYTMTARSRKMNVWAIAISAVVVGVTAGLFFVRRRG